MLTVTIVIPVYNAELYIEKTILSVINQTYKKIQLILVDDGSTDNSRKICEKYAALYKNVEILFQLNKGVSAARNLGLNNASGTYIQFVDSDDYIEKNMVESFIHEIEKNKCDLIICGYKNIDYQQDQITSIVTPKKILNAKVDKIRFFENIGVLYNELLLNSPWNKFYLKSIIDEYNISFDEGIERGEDLIFNINYFERCESVYFSENPYYNYVHYGKKSQSITSKFQDNIEDNEAFLYQSIKKFLIKNMSYQGVNKVIIERHFIKNLMGCLLYYFNFSNILSQRKLKNRVGKIVSMLKENEYFKYYKTNNLQERILYTCIKYRMTNSIIILAYIKKFSK